MAVTSREDTQEKDDEQPRRGAAVFSRKRLARQQTCLEQLVAWALLLISFVGSGLLGGGGVEAWVKLQPNIWLTGAAVALQGGLTYTQWVYAIYGWRSWKYDVAVLLSSAMTIGGFWQLVHPWRTGVLAGWQVPAANAPYIAGGLIILAAGLIDVFPERTLTA
jgi:hypothetical protein